MDILIDFDGTCVSHEFPYIGADIGAVPVLQDLVKAGHNLILNTMRSDKENVRASKFKNISGKSGKYLTAAVKWFKDNDIKLHGINTNPGQASWTSSPKAYGQLSIDDINLGTPLKFDTKICQRPFVDWVAVRKWLELHQVLDVN